VPARARQRQRRGSGSPPGCRSSLVAVVAALAGLACAEPLAPATRACAQILALQSPEAEVLGAWPGTRAVALDYRVEEADTATSHRLECAIAEPAPGRLRADALRIDGSELSEAELLLVNSELLLTEIRRADPGPPPAERRWTEWLEEVL
jgi:hypothetical protein